MNVKEAKKRITAVDKARDSYHMHYTYYGCPLCQFDMMQFAKKYEEIKAIGCELIIALQSDPDSLAKKFEGKPVYPYDMLCDPKQELYKKLEINVAETMESMAGPKTMEKFLEVQQAGFEHGEYEGEELQLPAVFIIDSECKLTYVHYGTTIDNIPTPEELRILLQ